MSSASPSCSTSSEDAFYGYRDQTLTCEQVITHLFQTSTDAADPTVPALDQFIAYALYRTRLPDLIIFKGLYLLDKLKKKYPLARGTATSPHRLFLSALMLASKISLDATYSNKSWQIVSQNLFSLPEVNQMERELFAFLEWNVVVHDDDLLRYVARVRLAPAASLRAPIPKMRASHAAPAPYLPTPAVTPPTASAALPTGATPQRQYSSDSDSDMSTLSTPRDCQDHLYPGGHTTTKHEAYLSPLSDFSHTHMLHQIQSN